MSKDDLFFKYRNKYPPQKGCLLISEPHLPDYNFERSVILLCEHNEMGSVGFVLNRSAEISLGEILSKDSKLEFPIGIGGPVEPQTLHFLHRNNKELEMATSISDAIYWGGNFEQATEWINSGIASERDFLFFMGYSGWSAGQLEEEIKLNSWIVFPEASEQLVFETRKTKLWKAVLKEMGGRFSVYANYPSDPRLN